MTEDSVLMSLWKTRFIRCWCFDGNFSRNTVFDTGKCLSYFIFHDSRNKTKILISRQEKTEHAEAQKQTNKQNNCHGCWTVNDVIFLKYYYYYSIVFDPAKQHQDWRFSFWQSQLTTIMCLILKEQRSNPFGCRCSHLLQALICYFKLTFLCCSYSLSTLYSSKVATNMSVNIQNLYIIKRSNLISSLY